MSSWSGELLDTWLSPAANDYGQVTELLAVIPTPGVATS